MNRRSIGLGYTPLMCAIIGGNEECAELLISCDGIDLELGCGHQKFTALLFAVSFDRMNIMNLLLKKGADPAARDECGMNSLMEAAEANNFEVMVTLLKTRKVHENARDYFTGLPALSFTMTETEP